MGEEYISVDAAQLRAQAVRVDQLAAGFGAAGRGAASGQPWAGSGELLRTTGRSPVAAAVWAWEPLWRAGLGELGDQLGRIAAAMRAAADGYDQADALPDAGR